VNTEATQNVQDLLGVGRHVNRSLDTHISRAITNNIVPLIPANSDLRYLLYEITENQWERDGKLILALVPFSLRRTSMWSSSQRRMCLS